MDADESFVVPEQVDLLNPVLLPAHAEVLAGLVGVPVEDAANAMFALMVPRGALDPSIDDADVPWCHLLARTINAPDVGFRIARKWFAGLHRLRHEDVPVSTVVEATAAYAAAGFAYACGKTGEHEWWMRTAAVVAEHEGLEVVTYLRAKRLLGALHEWAR